MAPDIFIKTRSGLGFNADTIPPVEGERAIRISTESGYGYDDVPEQGGGGQGPSPTLPEFTYQAETATFMTAVPNNNRRRYSADRMIKRLKTAGVWSKLVALWAIGDDANASRVNIKSPGTYDLVVNGAPTFTAGKGWSFPTISDFLGTGIPANSLGRDDVSMGFFTRERTGTAVSFDMGVQTGDAALYLKQAATTKALIAGVNGANVSPVVGSAPWDGLGLCSVSRRSSAAFAAYHGGVKAGDIANASTATTATAEVTIGKVNGQTTTCKLTINAAYVGVGLTDTEVAYLNAALSGYLDAVEFGDLEVYEAGFAPAAPAKYDLVVYGAKLAGVMAAYRAKQQGLSVAIVGGWRDYKLGGMTTGGLSMVDFDVSTALGGATYDMIMAARALDGSSIGRPSALTATPRSFQNVLNRMLDGARPNGQTVPVYWSKGVASVQKTGTKITSLMTVDGRLFTADYFIDTTEELDLAHLAGCTTILGREAASIPGTPENINGWCSNVKASGRNDVQIEDGSGARLPASQAYVVPGDPASGLLYGIQQKPDKILGQADASVMSYTFRLNFNSQASRRVPFGSVAPAGYSAAKYELVGRYCAAYPTMTLDTLMKNSVIAGGLTDTNNNSGLSTNLINSGNNYIAAEVAGDRAAVYAARELVQKDVESWVRGFIHYLLNSGDGRIPTGVVASLANHGWDYASHLDPHPNDDLYWSGMLYVREHRRIVGDFVLNGSDIDDTDGTAPRSNKTLSVISYRFDSHPHQRWVDPDTNTIFTEGSIGISQASSGGVANGANGYTPVPLECYLPKKAECTNLAVTFGLSATHVAVTASRMEMTTSQAGESLAYVVKNAKATGSALHDVDMPAVRADILAAPTTYAPFLPQLN